MAYRALYRVWRPQRFEDLVGQEHVTQTLKNALQEQSLSHAYLFHGSRGTGKTSAAKILAKAVNCELAPSPEPCNQCDACRKITEGTLMDVIEIDAASNRGVDEIRDLRENVKYAPTEVHYKVYIIDEVHMLTTEAFNALLKTLEEPPPHVIFLLATTEPHKLPSTILSRCQRFSFHRLPFEKIVERLRLIVESEGVEFEERALFSIARSADGGMRDALSLLDQVLAFGGKKILEKTVLTVTGSVSQQTIWRLFLSIAEQDISTALDLLETLVVEGIEPEKVLVDMMYTGRDMLLTKIEAQRADFDDELRRIAEPFSIKQLNEIMDQLIQTEQQMKWAAHSRILLEVTLVRLCMMEESASQADSELAQKVEQLEQMVERLQKEQPVASPEKVSHPPEPAKPELAPTSSSSLPRKGSAERLSQVKRAWPSILDQIKKERITVHAWLVDGEPVIATEDTIVVAFKSKIHRQTTDRPANRTVIEEVVQQVLNHSFTLQTCMLGEWQVIQGKEEMTATVEPTTSVVEKAIAVFGKELVQVKNRE